ncbi:hypothetical protein Acr_11g0010700 [Actinidia rufa]|uniref:Uncharacterized protein n=1 Tax=Actinidia rufa TaxID=165716 RepID=A0A7J0FDI6_9ERIC|nr:hypothetical protein Acr_11g0010700 [Actinidia rufa]
MREEKLKRNPRNPPHFPSVPSFSSSLLDQIYRSTDNGNEKFEELKFYRERIVKKNRAMAVVERNRRPDSYYEGSEFYLFDDIPQCGKNREDLKNEDGLMKTKLRALKIYNSLKKIKEPISPGGRLTSFINSLFANGNAKVKKTEKELKLEVDASIIHMFIGFFVFQIVFKQRLDEFEGEIKQWREEDGQGDLNLAVLEKTRKIEETASYILKGYAKNDTMFRSKKAYKDEEDEDDDDLGSDSSSDLFELDHLTFIGNNKTRYCEELPVYETTYVDTNRAIANGLIR